MRLCPLKFTNRLPSSSMKGLFACEKADCELWVKAGKRAGDCAFTAIAEYCIPRWTVKTVPIKAKPKQPIIVYIAAPYQSDPEQNTADVIGVADFLASRGFIPHVPHLYHYWDKLYPHPAEFWHRLDRAYLPLCQALFRVYGFIESDGADAECKMAEELGIPVFSSLDDLIAWSKDR